jgi:hypothetical protein
LLDACGLFASAGFDAIGLQTSQGKSVLWRLESGAFFRRRSLGGFIGSSSAGLLEQDRLYAC